MKRKKDLLEQGFEFQIFSNFPGHDLNFHGSEGDEIKLGKEVKISRLY